MIPIKYDLCSSEVFESSNDTSVNTYFYVSVLEHYYNRLKPLKESVKFRSLNKWCEKNISLEKEKGEGKWTFKDVVCASPQSLVRLKCFIDGLPNKKKVELINVSQYVVSGLYKNRLLRNGARSVIENELKISVCPYCNRNFIGQIVKNGRIKTTCTLDHFFPKGDVTMGNNTGYPLLAVSFFNLIPVCHYCNLIKGNVVLKAFYPHMFDWDEAHKLQFTFYPQKVDYLYNPDSIEVGVKIVNEDDSSLTEEYNNTDEEIYANWKRKNVIHDIDALNILEVYKNNRREIYNCLLKSQVFEDEYSEMIYNSFGMFFASLEEVKRLLLDWPSDDYDVERTPLGKLRYDIYHELR